MFIKPMLAAPLSDKKKDSVTYDNGYILEPKHDGMRAIVSVTDDGVEVYSRVGKTYATHVPRLVEQFEKFPVGTVLDGELMVVKDWIEVDFHVHVPVPDFNTTMRIMGSNPDKAIAKQEDHTISFFVFDILQWRSENLTELPYADRIGYLDHVNEYDLPDVEFSSDWGRWDQSDLDVLVATGVEGAILKHLDSVYHVGKRRANTWYKFKIVETADVVVMGFTDAKEGKTGKFKDKIGAVIFGAYDAEGVLHEVGQCSGMTDSIRDYWTHLREVGGWADKVIEIKYNDLVGDGTPRHPQYVAERLDKNVDDCLMTQFTKE